MAVVFNGARKKRAPDVADPRERELIESLNGRFDQINALWAQAEQKLRLFPIPVDVRTKIRSVSAFSNPQEDDGRCIHYFLGFAKSIGGWRICHGVEHDCYPDDEIEWKPISDCALDIRLEAIPHLPSLKTAVVAAAEQAVGTLDAGIAELRDAIAAF